MPKHYPPHPQEANNMEQPLRQLSLSPEMLSQRITALCQRPDLDQAHNGNHYRDELFKGIAKYLSIKKLYAIYNETKENDADNANSAFEVFKSIFWDFYGLNEMRRPELFNEYNFCRLMRENNTNNISRENYGDEEKLPHIIRELVNSNIDAEQLVHLVYASKAIHTINNELPIIDSLVASFFRLSYHGQGMFLRRFSCAINAYNNLVRYYTERNQDLTTLAQAYDSVTAGDDATNSIRNNVFNIMNQYNASLNPNIIDVVINYINRENINLISTVKKIDFMIWNYWRSTVVIIPPANIPNNMRIINNLLAQITDNRNNNETMIKNFLRTCHGYNNVIYMNMIPDLYLPQKYRIDDNHNRRLRRNTHKIIVNDYLKRHSDQFYKIYLVSPQD